MLHTNTKSGYICVPYQHDKFSIDVKDMWSSSRNIKSIYFVTATFSDECKPYFPSSTNHYLLAKFEDEEKLILKHLKNSIKKKKVNVILLTGGTGLTGRDSTPEAVKKILDKEIPGFGEIFRYVSFKKIGTSSLQSRAIAGLANGKFIFALPGSPGACRDAWNDILKYQLDSRTKPCNLVELIPRIFEKKKIN